MVHAKVVQQALIRYTIDNKGQLPASTNWSDALAPLVSWEGRANKVPPGEQHKTNRFGYNVAVAGKRLSEVYPKTVVIFELQQPGWNVSGGPEIVKQPRNKRTGGIVIGFADGHLEFVNSNSLSTLRWVP